MFKIRKILCGCSYVVRFQQDHINKFRYPYIQNVFSLILPMDVNNSTDKMPDYTDFSLLQNLCPNLYTSTVEYPTETSLYNWYYISELSNLTSLPSQCYRHSDGHTVCAVRQCTTVDILWASVQTEKDNELGVTFLNICACTSNIFCKHRTLWSTIQLCAV